MALVINSNIQSLNAQRNLNSAQMEQNEARERLSSGKRINSAADDAAGLAISNRMTSQINGLNQAVRNANDGVSLIQTAEGALDESTNILQRMRELSIQSANGTYDSGNRGSMNAEVQQLKAELDRISETTAFNGQNILDGSQGEISLQVGSESNQTISFEIDAMNSSSLGGNAGDIVGEATTNGIADLALFDAADGAHTLQVNDVDISDLSNGTTLNDKLDIINTDLEGKGAEASALVTVTADNVGDGKLIAGTSDLTLTVTDGNADTQTYNITDTDSLDELVAKINSDTTVDARIDEDGKLILSVEGATSLQVDDGSTGNGGSGFGTGQEGAGNATNFSLVFTDTSSDKSGVKIETGAANQADSDLLGINMQDDEGNIQGTTVTSTSTNTIQEGDLLINGVAVGAFTETGTAATTVDEAIKAINKVSDQTGVIAYESAGNTAQISLSSTTGW